MRCRSQEVLTPSSALLKVETILFCETRKIVNQFPGNAVFQSTPQEGSMLTQTRHGEQQTTAEIQFLPNNQLSSLIPNKSKDGEYHATNDMIIKLFYAVVNDPAAVMRK